METASKKLMRRRLAGAYVSSVISISLVLMLVGLATVLIVNARSVSDYFKETLQMSLILKDEVTQKQAEKYGEQLSSFPFIKAVRVVSREEGAEEMKALLGEDFMSVFEASPIPVSVDVSLKAEYVSSDSLETVKGILSASPLVDEISYQQSLVEALNANLARISLLLSVFVALLLFVSVVLIGNTVRLDVFSRRFTVHTMQLVGATASFIRGPFLKRAVFQGLVAAAVALVALCAGVLFVRSSFPELFEIFRPRTFILDGVIVMSAGVAVCVACTFAVVSKLLTLSKDELYG